METSVATPADEQKLEEMITKFYAVANMDPPQQLQINDEVASVFLKMLQEAEKCTDGFVLIPLPMGGISSARGTVIWMASNVTRTVYDAFSKKLSFFCVRRITYVWSMELQKASMEL